MKKNNKFPNAVLRLIVISDGYDVISNKFEIAEISNFILKTELELIL